MTVAELTAGTKVTCRPCAVNRPSCRATKKPAESTAGTTATFRSGCSMPGVAAFPPPESLGTNRIARTTTAATAPSISAARTARVNLRGIAGSFLPHGRFFLSRRRHRCSPVGRASASDSSVDWWPLGAGPGERGYSARLLPGSGQRDELPGAACEKNRAASCSERHRSADRYLNAVDSRARRVARPSPWHARDAAVSRARRMKRYSGMARAQVPRWSRYSRPSASQCRASAPAS